MTDPRPFQELIPRVIDASANSQGLHQRAEERQRDVIYDLGFDARRNGITLDQRPQFSDESHVGTWMQGWFDGGAAD